MPGNGEFDGTALQSAVRQLHCQYVCRTAPNLMMTMDGVGNMTRRFTPRAADAREPRTFVSQGPQGIFCRRVIHCLPPC